MAGAASPPARPDRIRTGIRLLASWACAAIRANRNAATPRIANLLSSLLRRRLVRARAGTATGPGSVDSVAQSSPEGARRLDPGCDRQGDDEGHDEAFPRGMFEGLAAEVSEHRGVGRPD